MQPSVWWTLGEWLGGAYEWYALLLLLGCLGPHLLALCTYLWAEGRRRLRPLRVSLELVYGLLNPVVYLLVFQPALFRSVSSSWLTLLSWALLGAYWGLRLLGPFLSVPGSAWRRPVRGLLLACTLLVAVLGLRDLVATWVRLGGAPNPLPVILTPLLVLLYGPLYLFPLAIARSQLRVMHAREEPGGEVFFLDSLATRFSAGVLAVLLAGAAAVAARRPSEAATRAQVLAHRADIVAASAHAGLDPRLLASIVFVTHREHTTPFRLALEEVAAAAWLVDLTSHMLISKALDPSLGLAQVKPVTVLTALWIHRASAGNALMPSKEYREVPEAGDAWKRIPAAALARVALPMADERPGKQDVVRALLDPTQNLALAAFVLDLTAAQWEAANPKWSIRARPDILATLYQIGFQRSHPKPDPQANDFGKRVLEVFNEPWMREHFAIQCVAP